MKNRILGTIAVLLVGISAHAKVENVKFKNVDVSSVINYFAEQVKVLSRDVVTYNWSQAGKNPFWQRDFSDDEAARLIQEDGVRSFWDNYGPQGEDNMYGFGLYTAVDPVATRSYGGSDWKLTQLIFPKGAKMLDLGAYEDYSGSVYAKDAEKILKEKFNCPDININSYFVQGGRSLTEQCRGLAKFVFDQQLKIQFFAYSYSQASFNVCVEAGFSLPRAFVVTRGEWVRPGLVRYFTAATKGNIEDRILIQTLFFDAVVETSPSTRANALASLKDYLMTHPNHAVRASRTECADDKCTIIARMCTDAGECEDFSLSPIGRSGGPIISASALASKFSAIFSYNKYLLWNDLEGKPKAKTSSEWLRKNSFTCTGQLPYESAQGDE